MRVLSQKPGAPGGARPGSLSRARSPRLPPPARLRSLSEPLRRVRAFISAGPGSRVPSAPGGPSLPPLPAPSRPIPFLSSRHGAGAARGRAPSTRLALGLALSATARLAPPRALPQSVAPEAPLSGGGGGGGSCFRFLPWARVGSSILHSVSPPAPSSPLTRGSGGGGLCGGRGGGDRGRRGSPALPPRITLLRGDTYDLDGVPFKTKYYITYLN